MIDPADRQEAIDNLTTVLVQAGEGSISEEDARGAATALIDREIKKRGSS
jgi:hypothetical protein